MKKIAFLIAASALLFAAPAAVQTADAQTSVRVGVDSGHHYGWRHRAYRSRSQVVVARPHCRTVVTKIWRDGVRITKKVRRCG
jgi:hypothetical protein